MDAARLHGYTDDRGEGLAVEAVDPPTVERSDGVLVEVVGAGWCQTDNHIIGGVWAEYVDQDLPMTLSHENAGRVVETGEEVDVVSEGDQVICHPVQTRGRAAPADWARRCTARTSRSTG